MAIKVKRLLSGIKKSNTYTILRGIGGSGKSMFLPKTNALKPLASAMGIQGETPLGVKCHMKMPYEIGVLELISCTKVRVML
ncbi:hypothetical protein KVD86_07320 [Helicobacter pylori]|nr:hypothetical protein KVD86_07320 [Helicobacter pylori]